MIELPFPSSELSGHHNKHFWKVRPIINKHREWAKNATLKALEQVSVDTSGDSDICISVTFYPPDRRGDRVNYPNRLKPYWDGIADALNVNDRRFLPSFHYALPVSNARVVFVIDQHATEQAIAA